MIKLAPYIEPQTILVGERCEKIFVVPSCFIKGGVWKITNRHYEIEPGLDLSFYYKKENFSCFSGAQGAVEAANNFSYIETSSWSDMRHLIFYNLKGKDKYYSFAFSLTVVFSKKIERGDANDVVDGHIIEIFENPIAQQEVIAFFGEDHIGSFKVERFCVHCGTGLSADCCRGCLREYKDASWSLIGSSILLPNKVKSFILEKKVLNIKL